MNDDGTVTSHGTVIETTGPWPFITHRRYRKPGHTDHIWQSRHHRKQLRDFGSLELREIHAILVRSFARAHDLNWWIGSLFAIGSLLFMIGSVMTLLPAIAAYLSFDALDTNAVFFAGSVPFTSAAFLQLYQADQRPPPDNNTASRRVGLLGWRVQSIGWISCALQFVGTVLFNFNTWDGMWPPSDRLDYNLAVWAPDFMGSVLFLASGYLAFIEVSHSYWKWQPKNMSWLVTFINLIGCVAFMTSAVFAFEPAQKPGFDAAELSVGLTLIGAFAFLVGSLMMLPESAE